MVAEAKSNRLSVVDVTFPELEKFDCLRSQALRGHLRLFPLWKAVASTVVSIFHIHEERKLVDPWNR